MNTHRFREVVHQIQLIARRLNTRPKEWCYLTSVDYMLDSRSYTSDMMKDLDAVLRHVKKGSTVLDIGTGCGIFASQLSAFGFEVSAIDTINNKSQSDPNFADTRQMQKVMWRESQKLYPVQFQHYDGRRIPFPDNSFDAITGYAVIEHIFPEDLDAVMKELRRVLKKDGKLFVFKFPRKLAYIEYVAKALGLGGHDIVYGDREGKRLFANYGFSITESRKSIMLFEYPGYVTNRIFWLLKVMEKVLYYTPFRIFAHHSNYVLVKEETIRPEILMLAPTYLPVVGGSETHVHDLVHYLIENNFRVTLITLSYADSEVSAQEHHDFLHIKRVRCLPHWANNLFRLSSPAYTFFIFPVLFFSAFFYMMKNSWRVRIVHVHAFTAGLSGAFLKAFFRNTKMVLSLHGIYFSKNPKHLRYNKYARFIRFLSRYYDAIFALGNRSKKEMISIGIREEKLVRYRYWIDENIFNPRKRLMKDLPLKVLFVGRLIEAKGVDIMLEVSQELPDIHFLFAGDGSLEGTIRKLSRTHKNIKLLGVVDQKKLPQYYSEADITAIFSQNDGEGQPRVLIESLFCGTPVIATDCGGAKEVVDPTVGFILGRDKESLKKCLQLYASDAHLRERMKTQCIPYAKKHFSIQQAQVFTACYKKLLQN